MHIAMSSVPSGAGRNMGFAVVNWTWINFTVREVAICQLLWQIIGSAGIFLVILLRSYADYYG